MMEHPAKQLCRTLGAAKDIWEGLTGRAHPAGPMNRAITFRPRRTPTPSKVQSVTGGVSRAAAAMKASSGA